jgi:hypothetical protein
MNLRRLSSLTALVALVLAVQITLRPSAAAAEFQTIPYVFVLTPDQCPDLGTTVTGSGEWFFRTNTRTDQDGVTHIVQNVTTGGTATDSEGNTYRFNYHNNQQVTIPPGEFPVLVNITDHFNLVGAGNAQSLHVGFTIRLTFAAPGEEPSVEEISVRGFPPCDPI